MPRKGEVPKREVLPDPKYTDAPVDVRRRITKFVNIVMRDGKKSIAEGIVYGAFDIVAERAKDDPLKVWDRALGNVKPKLEVKSPPRRWLDLPGAGRRSPGPLAGARHALAGRATRASAARRRWSRSSRPRSSTPSQNRGNAVKKREDIHKMADANKAFAHYRW